MVDNQNQEQKGAQKDPKSQTPGSNEETKEEQQQEESFSKAQVTDLIKSEIGKVTAKHAKQMDTLKAELEAEKRKQLPDPEKVKADLEDREKKIAEANAKLAAYETKEKKRAALDAVKLTFPKDEAGNPTVTRSDLLDMMPGNDDESIAASIEKFKRMFPESKALGTSTALGDKTKPSSIKERIAELENARFDSKLSAQKKVRIGEQIVSLTNKLLRGEA